MSKLIYVSVIMALNVCSFAYAVPTNAKMALSEASAGGQFLFLTFYQTKDASFTSLSSKITAFKKTSTKKIAVFNTVISDPINKEIADKYGIQSNKLPIALVFAPNGAITGGHPASVTDEQLKESVSISELMMKVVKSLQEQKVALVALQNSTTKFNAESWAGVSDFSNDPQYKQLVSAIKADPSAAGSKDFVKQCQLIGPITQATVVVLLPPGKIGKILTGKVTKADILGSLQACAGGSSCKPGSCSGSR